MILCVEPVINARMISEKQSTEMICYMLYINWGLKDILRT